MSKVMQLNKPQPKRPTRHSVTKEEVLDAIEYFHVMDMLEDMKTDERYYVEILLRKVANDYKILLEIDNNTIL
tara:strand:+ start:50 stop:268 length:219 start_codon:yes stop_codon:yes gene_type:complete